MKISNETKVGVLTAIAITLLILGFNFLKGKSVFKSGYYIFAKYKDTKGIMVSNPVLVNGFKVGSVYDIENSDPNLKDIIITIKLEGKFNIPKNSIASIKESALGSPSIEIEMGNDTHFLNKGDTLHTGENEGLFSAFSNKITPVGNQLKQTMRNLDKVLNDLNETIDPTFRSNIQQSIANVNAATASLVISANAIQTLLNAQSGAIAKTMNNANAFTKNLADNNEKVNKSMNNLEKTTEHLANADIDGTVASLKKAVDNLNGLLEKVNSKDGSVGMMLNDKTLYKSLTNTIRSTNILMDDIKVHPKRYINVSVFGNKDKSVPLSAPLNDSATH